MQNQAYSGAYTTTRHPLGTFHRQARQQSAEPETRSENTPQLLSVASVLIAAIPPPRGPQESTFLPLLLKWIRPLPANLNADRSIRSSRGGAGPMHTRGPGIATTYLFELQPRDDTVRAVGAGGRGGGGRDTGKGMPGNLFPRARSRVPPPEVANKP